MISDRIMKNRKCSSPSLPAKLCPVTEWISHDWLPHLEMPTFWKILVRRAVPTRVGPRGTLDCAKNGVSFAFYTSRDPTSSPSMIHSLVTRSGHGRTCCRMACKSSKLFSNNCDHHSQWHFQYCGTECKGGLCECLRGYSDDYGYYG